MKLYHRFCVVFQSTVLVSLPSWSLICACMCILLTTVAK